MRSAVARSSEVSKPDVVSLICKHKCWAFLGVVDDPGISRVEDCVLEEYNGSSFWSFSMINSKQSEDVAIVGGYLVLFEEVVVLLNYFVELESEVSFDEAVPVSVVRVVLVDFVVGQKLGEEIEKPVQHRFLVLIIELKPLAPHYGLI